MTDSKTLQPAGKGFGVLRERYLNGAIGDAIRSKASPAVFYSEEQMLSNMRVYEEALSEVKSELRYAIKACALSPVVECVARKGWGADCQSVMEAKLALKAGILPGKISICSPRLSRSDLPWIIKSGLRLIADSKDQLAAIADALAKISPPETFSLGARISLPVSGTERFQTKLGMEAESIIDALLEFPRLKPFVQELHHHGAARQTSPELLTEAASLASAQLLQIEKKTGVCFNRLNLGAGLEPESILMNEHGITTKVFFGKITAALDKRILESNKIIVLEPGRAIVKDAACALTAVTNLKMLQGRNIAVVDISTNLLIPLPLAQFFVSNADSSEDGELAAYDIVDGTCSPAGVICKDASLPLLKEGRRLFVHHVGAYTYSLAEPFYDWLPDLYWIDGSGNTKQIFDRNRAEQVVNLIWGYN